MKPLLILLALATAACAAPNAFMTGFDASAVPDQEQRGVVYKDLNNRPADFFQILSRAGLTHVRLRVWVDPTRGNHNGLDEVCALARRAQAARLKVLLCFHYSDTWADPEHQNPPPAWKDLSYDDLKTTLRDYNRTVVARLHRQGTPPDMIQIGNEVNNGMLWPLGRNSGSEGWDRFAGLITAAAEGIRAGEKTPGATPLMIHIANGGNTHFFKQLADRGVPFDIIGLSYYPRWHGNPDDMTRHIPALSKALGKPVVLVETSHYHKRPKSKDYLENPKSRAELDRFFKRLPFGKKNQAEFLAKTLANLRKFPADQALGLFYWGGEYASGGSPTALFDATGRALPALYALGKGLPPGYAFKEEPDTPPPPFPEPGQTTDP